jgi:biopolymer transport protein ExbD
MASLFQVQRRMLDLGLNKVSYANDVVTELPIILPTDDLKKKFRNIPKEDVAFVRIEASGKVHFNKTEVSQAKIGKVIEKNLQKNPNLIVSVYMDDKTRYEDFVTVLARIKTAGADKILVNDPAS